MGSALIDAPLATFWIDECGKHLSPGCDLGTSMDSRHPLLLVQFDPDNGYWLTSHPGLNDAARYLDSDDSDGYGFMVLIHRSTGTAYRAVTTTRFEIAP